MVELFQLNGKIGRLISEMLLYYVYLYSLQICKYSILKTIENIPVYLASNGVKPSHQRVRVFEYLYKYENHPTVEVIYQYLKDELPTLSKTTVYNTLNLFVENNITAEVNIEANEVRYDAKMDEHAHLKCTSCGMLQDVNFDLSLACVTLDEGFQVEETHLYLKGKCKECLINKK